MLLFGIARNRNKIAKNYEVATRITGANWIRAIKLSLRLLTAEFAVPNRSYTAIARRYLVATLLHTMIPLRSIGEKVGYGPDLYLLDKC